MSKKANLKNQEKLKTYLSKVEKVKTKNAKPVKHT
jgi:hypothetical protein